MSQQPCRYCGDPHSKVTRYANFKHYWHHCSSCGTMWRVNKESYPFTGLLQAIDKIPILRKIERRLLPSYLMRQDAEEDAYQSYGVLFHRVLDSTPGDEMFEVKRKRYLSEADDFLSLMRKHKIDVHDKKLLDISGGPGTFAHFINRDVGSIAVTEYGENSVRAMREYLPGINVFHADINDKWVHDQHYDLLLYRSCLYFCNDFERHLQDISRYLNPGGFIYICTTAPSLGNSLRWQYEDYTHNVLYSQESVVNTLKRNGYDIMDTGYTDFYPHFLKHYGFRDRAFHRWGIWNRLKPGVPKSLDARAHWVLARK